MHAKAGEPQPVVAEPMPTPLPVLQISDADLSVTGLLNTEDFMDPSVPTDILVGLKDRARDPIMTASGGPTRRSPRRPRGKGASSSGSDGKKDPPAEPPTNPPSENPSQSGSGAGQGQDGDDSDEGEKRDEDEPPKKKSKVCLL